MPYENSPSLRLLEVWTGKDRTSIEPSQKAKSRAGQLIQPLSGIEIETGEEDGNGG